MSWFKKSSPPPPPVAAPVADESPNLGRVLDTLTDIVRAYGKGAFDIEGRPASSLRDDAERWAKHLLVGAGRPGEDAERGGLPLERRDWVGVRKFLAEKRAEEASWVSASQAALHQSLWVTLKALDTVVAETDGGDNQVREEMNRLEQVAKYGSVEEIRREVMSVVGQVEAVARERARLRVEAVEALKAEVHALGDELEIARQESAVDGLTRLYNRRSFDERCTQILAMRRLFGEPSSLLMVDVDHFKLVNDKHGHPAGDQVLREVADCMARTFVSRSDVVARYGGEEFAILLWGTGIARAKAFADRLLDVVRERVITYDDKQIQVTVSVGVADLGPGESKEAWVARADAALYDAKKRGRDRAVVAQ